MEVRRFSSISTFVILIVFLATTVAISSAHLRAKPVAAVPSAAQAPGPSGYHLLKKIKLGGEGFWDYIAFDSPTRRLFISRGTKVVVLDVDSEKVVGEIPDTAGVHGIALASPAATALPPTGKRARFPFST